MSKNNTVPAQGIGEEVQIAIGKAEAFIEKYQKQLVYGVAVIVLVTCGILLFNKFYVAPKNEEAQTQMAKGFEYFTMAETSDSLKTVALTGDGNEFIGFNNIIKEYGITKSANLAHYFAGILEFELGQYQKAIDHLSKFDANGSPNFEVVAAGKIGDAQVELGDLDKALSQFKKAANMNNKELSPVYLKKAGAICEEKGDFVQAVELYTTIKNTYPQHSEARDIEKYITRANLKK